MTDFPGFPNPKPINVVIKRKRKGQAAAYDADTGKVLDWIYDIKMTFTSAGVPYPVRIGSVTFDVAFKDLEEDIQLSDQTWNYELGARTVKNTTTASLLDRLAAHLETQIGLEVERRLGARIDYLKERLDEV